MLNRHRSSCRDPAVGPVPGVTRCEDVERGQRGEILSDRIVELEAPLLVEHHDGHARDRLRHRGDPEDRVGSHRRARVSVRHAVGSEVSLAAFPRDQGDRPSDRIVVHVALHDLFESAQTLCGEPDVCGRDGRKPLRPSGRRSNHTNEQHGEKRAYAHHRFLCNRFDWFRPHRGPLGRRLSPAGHDTAAEGLPGSG